MPSYSKKVLKELKNAIDASYEDLKPFREANYESIERYVGSRYGAAQLENRPNVPINLIQLATDIYVQNIAPLIPRFNCVSKRMGLDRGSDLLALGLNHSSKEIDLGSNYQEMVLNAIFCMGIMKVGTAAIDKGTLIDATQPYAEPVSIHNWVHDTNAERYENCTFSGDRCFIDWEDFKESGLYKNTDKVSPYVRSDGMDDSEQWETRELSGAEDRKDEFRKVVQVWEIFLPGDGKIITIPADGDAPCVLREIDASRERGPYVLLSFQDVPDNVMPVSPASTWQDIHDLANDIMVKLANQSRRQKTVVAYGLNSKDDAKRVKDSADGEMIAVNDPSQLKEMNFGGADAQSQGMLAYSRDLFSYMAGNLDVLGGLSATADTLGQEQLMGASSSKRMVKMRQRSMGALEQIGEAIADELWNDPNVDLPLIKEYPGSGIKIPMRFNQDEKEGDFIDYNIEIDPYSMTHKSPSERLQIISQLLQQFIMPFMPMVQAQGGQINMQQLCEIMADYADTPELKRLLVFADAPQDEGSAPITPGQGAKTTREYVRKNIPTGGTRASRDNVIMQLGMGGNPQQKQRDSINRVGA